MTALQLLNALKSDRANAVLWIDHDRREAAFHPGRGEVYATVIDYSNAMTARTDPALNIEKHSSGELISA